MVCAPVRRDNPRALARGLSTVQTNHARHYGVSRAKDWVSVNCMVCAPVRRDNPRALARGFSTVLAHKHALPDLTFTTLTSVVQVYLNPGLSIRSLVINCSMKTQLTLILQDTTDIIQNTSDFIVGYYNHS